MASYLELHMALERKRSSARAVGSAGPSVLIAGPTDTGKSSLCRLLANYLARSGSTSTFIDLDISQGAMSIPGCICAVPIHRPLDIEVRESTPAQDTACGVTHVVAPFSARDRGPLASGLLVRAYLGGGPCGPSSAPRGSARKLDKEEARGQHRGQERRLARQHVWLCRRPRLRFVAVSAQPVISHREPFIGLIVCSAWLQAADCRLQCGRAGGDRRRPIDFSA